MTIVNLLYLQLVTAVQSKRTTKSFLPYPDKMYQKALLAALLILAIVAYSEASSLSQPFNLGLRIPFIGLGLNINQPGMCSS